MPVNKMPDFPGVIQRSNRQYILNDEQTEWLKNVFPIYENKRIAEKSGLTNTTLHSIARRLGLKKSADGLKAIKHRQAMHIKRLCEKNGYYKSLSEKMRKGTEGYARTREAHKAWLNSDNYKHYLTILKEDNPKEYKKRCRRMSRRRKELMEEERKRIRLGIPRQTKLIVATDSTRFTRAQIHHRHQAMRRGYIVGHPYGEERMMIFYDDDTQRARIFEKNCKKDGFIILPEDYEQKASHDYYNVGNL